MHQAFLRSICEEPDRDDVRLIYADWLEENGNKDDWERAEFIRVQCKLAGYPADEMAWGWQPRPIKKRYAAWKALKDREVELLAVRRPPPNDHGHLSDVWATVGNWQAITHGGKGPFWLYPPAPDSHTGHEFVFHRGFVASVACPLEVWLKHGPQVVGLAPVETVRFPDREVIPANGEGPQVWLIAASCERQYQHWFPAEWFPEVTHSSGVKVYDSEVMAWEDVSRRAVDWARAKAKPRLPALRREKATA